MTAKFIHLRTHSSYSLSEGAIKIDDLVDLAKNNKMPAFGLADDNNLFAALEFSLACAKKSIQPILGCVLKLQIQAESYNSIDDIFLLAQNEVGLKNLINLVSIAHTSIERESVYIKLSELRSYSDGLFALTSGIYGTCGKLILNEQFDKAEKFIQFLDSMFPGRLYVELMRHNNPQEKLTEKIFIDFAYKYNLPLIATNDVYYATKDMYEAHDALLCIAAGRYITEDDRKKSDPNWYFKTQDEMAELFFDIPEALENSVNLARRCSALLEDSDPILPNFSDDDEAHLVKEATDGLAKRLELYKVDDKSIYYNRLEYELGIITKMKFSGYFLIVSDFIKWSKRHNIPVGPGRGSGAGSIVSWSMYITDLDPIRFGLIFERFLNPERISMPDFDIDFCQERRDEVIEYVRQKYGKDRVANIITFGKLQAKAVIRDVGRVLQLPYTQVDRISKLVPFNSVNPVSLTQAIEMEPLLKEARNSDPQIGNLIKIALQLEGLNRHVSTHAAGVVISHKPLKEIVPLYRDQKSGSLVIQYSMKYAELSGLVKFDFLGLKTLTVISKTIELIRKKHPNFDIETISFEDSKTYEMLSQGLSTGVFQFESSGMKDALRKLKPDRFEDIIALGALYRPGPMDNIPAYIARKHLLEKPDYPHPILESILQETYGVIIYQEQVLQIAQIFSGYSLGAADLLRRAMGKKIKSEMDAQCEIFVNGAVASGIEKKRAREVFDLVAKFAGYGFNKAHATAYAKISYQTAYLKANFPVEFMVASMNLEINDTDKINHFCNEAKMINIEILPPDLNQSDSVFQQHKDCGRKILYGLGALKNAGVHAMEELLKERNQHGDFKDIFDLASRCGSKILNKRMLESLIASGSVDKLCKNRRSLFESVDMIIAYSSDETKNKNNGQINLFSAAKGQNVYIPKLLDLPEWSDSEKLQKEFEAIGFYLVLHPLENYLPILKSYKIRNCDYIANELKVGYSHINMAGIAVSYKTRSSVRGRYITAIISDLHGNYELSVFDDQIIAKFLKFFEKKSPMLISTDIRKDSGGYRVSAKELFALDSYFSKVQQTLKIWVHKPDVIKKIRDICEFVGSGNCKIKFVVTNNGAESEVIIGQFKLDANQISEISNMDGVSKIISSV